ncbi:MAG: sugar ABC transporter ATP-binding protein, partial [Janthinobacterium lividum]
FFQLNGARVISRVHPGAVTALGHDVPLWFDVSKAVLFDAATEARIA